MVNDHGQNTNAARNDSLSHMPIVTYGRWRLDCDTAVTRQKYAQIASGAPEVCGCATCRNFAAARKQIYPTTALRLFEELGIAVGREAEVYHNCRLAPGQHRYGGWFHLVGTVVSGADASRSIGENAWTFDLEDVNDAFKMGFTCRIGLLSKVFEGYPVVQLEFQAIAPWLLSKDEPE